MSKMKHKETRIKWKNADFYLLQMCIRDRVDFRLEKNKGRKHKKDAVAPEAEAYPGPSLIIAYAPCINHGIKKGMAKAQTEEELAVKCGYWHNFRFNPAADKKFALDSKTPDMENYMDFLNGEVRYNSLQRQNPEKAARLFAKNESEAKARYAYLNKLVAMYGEEE